MVADHGDLYLFVYRCNGQVRSISTSRLVARFHGGANANFGIDTCCDNGHCGNFYGGTDVAIIRALGDRIILCVDHRIDHGLVHGFAWSSTKRHQASGCLFHVISARIHDGSTRCVGVFGSNFSFDDTCVFQSAFIFGCGLGHYRDAPRSRYATHGWLA